MARKPVRGLFITGTDTDVGKTYVGTLIAAALVAQGYRVGVYKPAASGCRRDGDMLESDDARALWMAAGSPGTLNEVCPQRFVAPVAPHLAAIAEGKRLDAGLLRRGLDVWLDRSDVVLVEGAGGLMSPLGEEEYVADLAYDFGFPLVVVARNGLGAINHVLQTLITAATFRDGLPVAGIVLNEIQPRGTDLSIEHNAREISSRASSVLKNSAGSDVAWMRRQNNDLSRYFASRAELSSAFGEVEKCHDGIFQQAPRSPVLAALTYQSTQFDPSRDWFRIAAEPERSRGADEDGAE